jgi:hypothetical protein
MTEVHNFVLRWARLKRASDAWHKVWMAVRIRAKMAQLPGRGDLT